MPSSPLVNAVELRNVSVRADSGREILHQVNLEVRTGETLVLLGRSGSGKTTTLKLINQLVLPSAGEVWVEGEWDQNAPRAAVT